MSDERPEQEFKDGSLVQLKSGSPVMTVPGFGNFSGMGWKYSCKWWDANKKQFATETFNGLWSI
jgi:uncharacterized protein YodC (DUF2158 family)